MTLQNDFWLVLCITIYLSLYLVYMAVRLEKYSATQLIFMAIITGIALKLTYNLYLIR